ncbi:MAG: corrinoid protein [Desulfobacteraceae bacterium]|jgi:5-methyltetrahydrofolate--homocysteine methyltransferase|nr:corrinoid protein [Desulfobacteraceae bacterium]
MVDLEIIAKSVIEGGEEEVKKLVQQAITEGMALDKLLSEGLIAGMNVVGEQMRTHEMFIPEVLRSANAMSAGMDLMTPLLKTGELSLGTKVVLGTVKGDLHNIGKNLVGMMFKGAGFQVVDLGVDVPAERFVQAVVEHKAEVLAMSALLTTTMPVMRNTIEALQDVDLQEKVKVIVGGAPLSLEYANKIGADGYARDAARAVDKVRELIH